MGVGNPDQPIGITCPKLLHNDLQIRLEIMRFCAYKCNVTIPIIQVQLNALIARTGMNDRELGVLLGVAQSTAWRLRNGKIRTTERYVHRLREHLGDGGDTISIDDMSLVTELVALSSQLPELREALLALYKFMRISA